MFNICMFATSTTKRLTLSVFLSITQSTSGSVVQAPFPARVTFLFLAVEICPTDCASAFPPVLFHTRTFSYRRDGVVVRASASQSVDLRFIPLIESYQKTLKNGIHSFPAWRSAFRGGCGEQAGKFACCVLGQGT